MKPEIVTVAPETTIRKTRLAMAPSTARRSAPGPLIGTLLSTANSPVVSVITPEMPVASIISPLFASESAWRREPGPLSLVLLTIMVLAFTEIARPQPKVKQIATALSLLTLLFRRIARKLQLFESNMIVTVTNPVGIRDCCDCALDGDRTSSEICVGSGSLSALNRPRKTMRLLSLNQIPLLTPAYDVVKNGAALDLLRGLAASGCVFCLVY